MHKVDRITQEKKKHWNSLLGWKTCLLLPAMVIETMTSCTSLRIQVHHPKATWPPKHSSSMSGKFWMICSKLEHSQSTKQTPYKDEVSPLLSCGIQSFLPEMHYLEVSFVRPVTRSFWVFVCLWQLAWVYRHFVVQWLDIFDPLF